MLALHTRLLVLHTRVTTYATRRAALALGTALGIAAALAVAVPASAAPARAPIVPPSATDAFAVVDSPALPVGSVLNGIANGPDGQAWAVGQVPGNADAGTLPAAVIEHWDGSRWTLESLPDLPPINGQPITESGLTAVTAGPDGRVYAVGYQRPGNRATKPLVLRREPSGWTPLPPVDGLANVAAYQLVSVSVLPGGQVWVAGYSTYHKRHIHFGCWDGSAWLDLPYPEFSSRSDLLTSVVALGPDDVWLAGGVYTILGGTRPMAWHWDGTAWTSPDLAPMNAPASGALPYADGMAADPERGLWLWGTEEGTATIERWDGSAWSVGPVLPAAPASVTIAQVAPLGAGRALLAGTYPVPGATDGRTGATVQRWEGSRWTALPLPVALTAGNTIGLGLAAGTTPTWAYLNTSPTAADPTQTTPTILRYVP